VIAGITALRNSLLRGDVPLERLHQSANRITGAKARFLGDRIEISTAKVKAYFNKDV